MKTVFFSSNQGRKKVSSAEPDYIINQFSELRQAIAFLESRRQGAGGEGPWPANAVTLLPCRPPRQQTQGAGSSVFGSPLIAAAMADHALIFHEIGTGVAPARSVTPALQ